MTNKRDAFSQKNNSHQKKTTTKLPESKSHQVKYKRTIKSYEAARRRRFNDNLELLRLELQLDECPKVKIVESATDYIKHCKVLQKCILQEEEDTPDIQETKKTSHVVQDVTLKLRRKITFYKHLLKEANITVDLLEESNHIHATFPVLQMAQNNIVIKKKKKVYDLFYNTIELNSSEDVVSKNVACQCEKGYFDWLNSNNNISQNIISKTPAPINKFKSTPLNLEKFTTACLSNGKIAVGDVNNGMATVWLHPDESALDKPMTVNIGSDNHIATLNDVHKQTSSNLLSVSSNYNISKATPTILREGQEIIIPPTPAIGEDIIATCPRKVYILHMQKMPSPPQTTLVTQSPSQGPIMSTGRNGPFLKVSNQNSVNSVSSIMLPCRRLKKIAPKPKQGDKLTTEKEKISNKPPVMSDCTKRKSLWKSKDIVKMAKLSVNTIRKCNSGKIDFEDDTLQEIPTSTLNNLVRNAVIMAVDREDQPLDNIMEFSCMTNTENSDSENTLETEENIVEMLCSIADSNSVNSDPTNSLTKVSNSQQVSRKDHISFDNKEKNKEISSISLNKIREANSDFCEAAVFEPSIAKSNYSVMSLCMPSKIGKINSPKSTPADNSIEPFKTIHNNVNEIEINTTTGDARSLAGIVTEVSKECSGVELGTSSLSASSIPNEYALPFPNITVAPTGLSGITTIPFISDTVTHSISRISAPTISTFTNEFETNQKVKVVTSFAEEKSNDSKPYNGSSVPTTTVTQTTSMSANTAGSTLPSTQTTSISSSIFSLSTIPSYSRTFGFCPLSITEAPTTFSFTLTTQSSGSPVAKTSMNISLPYSSQNIYVSEATNLNSDKSEIINTPGSASNIQVLSSRVSSTEENSNICKLNNMQSGLTPRDSASENILNFNKLNTVNCGHPPATITSGEKSIYSPLFRTPLKANDIAETPQKLCSPFSSWGTESISVHSDLQLNDSITYSSCSLSSVSSVFSASDTLNISLQERSMSETDILKENEKDTLSKNEIELNIDRPDESNSSESLNEEKDKSSRLSCNQNDVSGEFRMPLLPLSSYASCNLKANRDLAEETFSLHFDEQDEMDKNFSTDTPKKSQTEFSRYDLSKGKDTIFKDSFTEENNSSSDKEKKSEEFPARSNRNMCHESKNELEIEQSSLENSSEILFISEANKQPINSSKCDKNQSLFYSKEIVPANISNESNSRLLETQNDNLVNEISLTDTHCLFNQPDKTFSDAKPISINSISYRYNKHPEEVCSNAEKVNLDKRSSSSIKHSKGITSTSKDISYTGPKHGYGADIKDSLVAVDSESESRKKERGNNMRQEKSTVSDNAEKCIDISLTKNCDECKPIVSAKISENLHASTSEDVTQNERSNVQLKLCVRPSAEAAQTQPMQEQSIAVVNPGNSQVTPSTQKFSPKTQTTVSEPIFSNACVNQSVPIQSTHSPANTINKNMQTSGQILICGSDSMKRSLSSPNSTISQFEGQSASNHSINEHQIQQNVVPLTQQQSTILQNNQAADIFPFYPGTEREPIKSSSNTNSMPTMAAGCSYMQTFDYNYYRKPSHLCRLDSRYNCHGYKQFSQNNSDFLPDAVILPNQPPTFLDTNEDLSIRGLEIPPSDHVRGFSVSHLVSHSSDTRKITQKDHVSDDKLKEVVKVKTSKKSDGKSRISTASKNSSIANEARQRAQPRSVANFSPCFNNKPQQKNIPNYSTEALLSSQNYIRQNHRQPINQNYHLIPHNQMYQTSYSSQQVKNLSQNAPFSYSNHDRTGPPMHCNTDYNFQLHPQTSTTLTPYGSNMPYMAPSYPYQNIPPSSGDIMGTHHPGTYRFPDISDQTNFHSNATFSLPIESQDVCAGNVIASGQTAMTTRMPVSEPAFGISASPSMHYRSSVPKNGSIQQQGSGSVGKRSKYFDTGMIASGVTTPTNFLEGGSLTHIPINSFTPPCEDPTALAHTNLLSSASRHQNNFIIGHENAMPLNSSHYQDVNINTIGGNLNNQHLQMPSVSKSAAPVPQIFSTNSSVRSDRQLNTPASHLSSSLSNFNLTSIIPEIDGKHEDSSAMSSSNSRHISGMGSDSVSMVTYNRLPNMGATFVPTANMKDGGVHTDASHRFVPINSMNNIFGHPHQVGLNLNSGLPIPTSTFSGMSFQSSEH